MENFSKVTKLKGGKLKTTKLKGGKLNANWCIIFLIIIIVGMICISLLKKKEQFFNYLETKITTEEDYYSHKYFSPVSYTNTYNLYFLVNKNPNDQQNVYFVDRNLKLRKKFINENDYCISDKEIFDLAFYVQFPKLNENIITFYSIPKKSDNNEEIEKLMKKTFPKDELIKPLENVIFLRNEPGKSAGDISKGFKIKKKEKNDYLEVEYGNTIIIPNKNEKFECISYTRPEPDEPLNGQVIFKDSTDLSELYKHTFYLIPYYCQSNINTTKYYSGRKCMFRN